MGETRKIAAILVADVVGYSRLAGADEDRTLSRLRGLRSDLTDPAIAAHHGRIVKRTGDGFLIEFRSVVDAVRCAIEVQTGLIERNAGVPPERRIEFRIGSPSRRRGRGGRRRPDGRRRQYRGAARRHREARRDLSLGATPTGKSRGGSISRSPISARRNSRTSPSRSGSIRLTSARPPRRSPRRSQRPKNPPRRASRSSSCRSPISAATRSRSISSTESRRA